MLGHGDERRHVRVRKRPKALHGAQAHALPPRQGAQGPLRPVEGLASERGRHLGGQRGEVGVRDLVLGNVQPQHRCRELGKLGSKRGAATERAWVTEREAGHGRGQVREHKAGHGRGQAREREVGHGREQVREYEQAREREVGHGREQVREYEQARTRRQGLGAGR